MRGHRELLEAAMASLSRGHRAVRRPQVYFWARVRDHFAVGSTSAKEICREFGHDQDTGEVTEAPAGFFIQNRTAAEHVLWWRAGGAGYTTDLHDAGIFSEEEAQRIAGEHGRPEDRAIPVTLARSLARSKTTVAVHDLAKAVMSQRDWWQKVWT
jgi:hypothetical protein